MKEAQTPLGSAVINGVKIIMREAQLIQLLKAHEELTSFGIGANGKKGFVPANETTASYRSEALQAQLVAKGSSKTMQSNHRRGVAVDCFANWNYINAIKPTMNKYGFFNDLAYVSKDWKVADDSLDNETPIPWDGGHWNWKSNSYAWQFDIIPSLPALVRDVSMNTYENHLVQMSQVGFPESGAFALVLKGQKHLIDFSKDHTPKALQALFTVFMRGMIPSPLTKEAWDAIPTGDAWHDYKG